MKQCFQYLDLELDSDSLGRCLCLWWWWWWWCLGFSTALITISDSSRTSSEVRYPRWWWPLDSTSRLDPVSVDELPLWLWRWCLRCCMWLELEGPGSFLKWAWVDGRTGRTLTRGMLPEIVDPVTVDGGLLRFFESFQVRDELEDLGDEDCVVLLRDVGETPRYRSDLHILN